MGGNVTGGDLYRLGAVTGGMGLAVTAVLLDAGGTLAQGLIPNPPETNDLAAPTAMEIGGKIMEAMSKLGTDTAAEEQRVAAALRQLAHTLQSQRQQDIVANRAGDFSVAASALDDATASQVPDRFHPAH